MLTFLKSFVKVLKEQHLLEKTIFDSLQKNATLLVKSDFPELQEAYKALCIRHNITSPPSVYVHSCSPAGAYAFTKKNAIFLNDFFLNQYSHEERISILAHELGHVLRGDIGASVRHKELATDRLAVTMIGDHAPLASVIRHTATQFNQEQDLLAQSGWMGRTAQFFRHQQLKQNYGTHAERLANALHCDTKAEQTQLDKLLEERKRASIVHRPFFR